MTTTNLSNAAFKSGDDYAFPHSKVDGQLQAIEFVNLDNAAPAGSINSSAAEMASGSPCNSTAENFPPAVSASLASPVARNVAAQTILPAGQAPGPLAPLSTKFAAYALGWGLRDYHGANSSATPVASPVSFLA